MSKLIKKAQNKAGTWFAIAQLDNGNQVVYKLCSNYNGNVRGGISKSWRGVMTNPRMNNTEFQKMMREGLTAETARVLFEKKLKGKQK